MKKNAEFSRRCNGFFIDLLSTVCFKDNTPPETHVITHLLSYLIIETGTFTLELREYLTKYHVLYIAFLFVLIPSLPMNLVLSDYVNLIILYMQAVF